MKRIRVMIGCALVGLTAFATEYTIKSKNDPMPPVTGDDVVIVNLDNYTERFVPTGDNASWSGVLEVRRGIVKVTDPKSLGSARLVNTNELPNVYIQFLLMADMEVKNDIVLGNVNCGDSKRLFVCEGAYTVTLSGKLWVNNTQICTTGGGRLILNGEVDSIAPQAYQRYLTFVSWSAANAPHLTVNGKMTLDTFLASGANTIVDFHGKGQALDYVFVHENATIRTREEGVFAGVKTSFGGHALISQPSGGTLDLYGTSQSFRFLHRNDGKLNARLDVVNSDPDHPSTLTVCQNSIQSTGGNLSPRGVVNVVKTGAEALQIDSPFTIGETLTVREGMLKLTGTQASIGHHIVVEENGVLDLGGNTYACDLFELRGGVVQNGTLLSQTNLITGGSCVATLAGGVTVKSTATSATLVGGTEMGHTSLTNGLVCCYHFDTAETLLNDASGNGYTLENCWTNFAFKVDASRGPVVCADQAGRFGTGCAYFSEHVFLRLAGDGYPAKAPAGRAPFTYAFWFKMSTVNNGRRGFYFLGKAVGTQANGMYYNYAGSEGDRIIWYDFEPKNDMAISPNAAGTFRDDGWHSVVQTWDGGINRYYLDGVEQVPSPLKPADCKKTRTTVSNIVATHFYVGAGDNTGYFSGWMDEVAMWDRALTPGEVDVYLRHGVRIPAPSESARVEVEAGTLALANLQETTATITNGIVAQWTFDSAEHLFEDVSGNGAALTCSGGAGVTCVNVAGAFGGGCASFDGNSKLVLLNGYANAGKIPAGNDPFTVGFHFLARGVQGLFAAGKGSDGRANGLTLTSNGTILSYQWGFQNENNLACPGNASYVSRVAWHSLVESWDGTTLHFYIDGVEVPMTNARPETTRTATTPFNVVRDQFIIGNGLNNANLNGYMDEFTVWNRGISAAEAAHFARFATHPATGEYARSAVVSVAPDATLAALSGSFAVDGTLVAGGTFVGDLVLKDGAVVQSEQGRTMTVNGVIDVQGSGTLIPETIPASYPATWIPFAAAGGFSADSSENLRSWIAGGLPPKIESRFRVSNDGEDLVCRAMKAGMTVFIR